MHEETQHEALVARYNKLIAESNRLKRLGIHMRCLLKGITTLNPTAILYHGIKIFSYLDENDKYLSTPEQMLSMYEDILFALYRLTPRQLMGIFPIGKKYGGANTGGKNYYRTMEALTQHGLDVVMADNNEDIFWNYCNEDIAQFMTPLLCIFYTIYKNDTGRNIFEDFFTLPDGLLVNNSECINPAAGKIPEQNDTAGEIVQGCEPLPEGWRIIKGKKRHCLTGS